MPQLTRGPLDPGVYWRRRVFVVLTALTLVFVVGEVLGGGSDGDDPVPAASQVAAEPSSPTTAPDPASGPTSDGVGGQGRKGRRGGPSPSYGPTYDPDLLAEPEGTCADDDISVTPGIDDAVALRPVTITLSLRTLTTEACTWTVSPKRLTVRVGNGDAALWSTQDCPSTVPTQDVVVRRAISTPVEITWNARESDNGCPTLSDWVDPGRYVIDAAALGGEPASSTFSLLRTAPEPATTDDPTGGTGGSGGTGGTGGSDGVGPGGTEDPIDPPSEGEPSNTPPVR